MRLRIVTAVLGSFLFFVTDPVHAAITFTNLGNPGGYFFRCLVLSADGQVVAGTDGTGVWRWAGTSWEPLVPPFATSGVGVQSASQDGSTLGGAGWRWDAGVFTPVLGPTGLMVREITGMSADGTFLVGNRSIGGPAFVWDDGVAASLLSPSGTGAGNPVVSADGSVIAADYQGGNPCCRSFRSAGGVSADLPLLAGTVGSDVEGISADGTTIVGSVDDPAIGERPVVWTDAGVELLPPLSFQPASTNGQALDVSADGRVIVGYSGPHATLWFDGVAYTIRGLASNSGFDFTGYAVQFANEVSDDGGTIIGNGIGPTGPMCWRATFDACQNGLDDDGDGLTDYPNDPGCANSADGSERSPSLPCDDGIDNDGDGLVDFPNDPACQTLTSTLENPKCDDDLDNDGDGKIDWDGGAGAGTPDPQCADQPWKNRESARTCGLGAELAGILGALIVGRRRIRR